MTDIINKVIQGDCREVMKDIPDKSVDMILVDPPYGINYKEWDKFENFIEFTESWVKECFRVLKDDGSFYSFMGWSNVAEFKILLDKYGIIKNWITWHRTKGRGSKSNFKSMKEEILFYTKGSNYTWNEQKMLKKHIFPYVKDGKPRGWFTNEEGEKCRWTGLGNVWFYTVPFWKMQEWCGHPSQKPVMMMERIILSSSNEGDTILDPFAGSGTTGVACKNLNRNYILIEKEPEYTEIINNRLNGHHKDL
jgi:site-specific DNA-methyltransferase (adenine-specific)